jgi:hypothetical protein
MSDAWNLFSEPHNDLQQEDGIISCRILQVAILKPRAIRADQFGGHLARG